MFGFYLLPIKIYHYSAISPNKEYVFSLDDGKLNLVQCVELARLTKSNRFGTGFLELCLMDLRQWNLD